MFNRLVDFIMGEDDIFDDFELSDEEKKKILEEREKNKPEDNIEHSEFTPPPQETPKVESKTETTFVDKPKQTYVKPKITNRKVSAVIGLSLFVGVGVLLYLALTGAIDVVDEEPFDSSQCTYGVHQDFFGERCMTSEEKEKSEQTNPAPTSQEQLDEEQSVTQDTTPRNPIQPKQEVESTFVQPDPQVAVVNGYYIISSGDSWYGDYIDGSEVPRKIELNQATRINFQCYTDPHLKTSVYFGVFRNNVENDLTVEVYIEGMEANSKTTTSNKALILEGSCYGHES